MHGKRDVDVGISGASSDLQVSDVAQSFQDENDETIIHENYAELLKEVGIDVEVVALPLKQEPNQMYKLECCANRDVIESGIYMVCASCGMVCQENLIEKDVPLYTYRRHYRHEGTQMTVGAEGDSYVARKRHYKPLTHFRQHLRDYLNARCVTIPRNVLTKIKVDVDDRGAYFTVKKELKRIGRVDLYRDVFSVIYLKGGRVPQVKPEQIDVMCNYFQRWIYHYNQMNRYGKHNCPSVYMLLDIILREYGHEPYYYIPSLKSEILRAKVYTIYEKVKCLCGTSGNF